MIIESKINLVERLYKEGHITFQQALILMEKEIKYIPASSPNPFNQPIIAKYGNDGTGNFPGSTKI